MTMSAFMQKLAVELSCWPSASDEQRVEEAVEMQLPRHESSLPKKTHSTSGLEPHVVDPPGMHSDRVVKMETPCFPTAPVKHGVEQFDL